MKWRKILIISIISTLFLLLYKVIDWYNYNQVFNKSAWIDGDEGFGYPQRKYMLNDLIEHHKIKGLTYKQLVNNMGYARIDSGSYEAYYNVILDYGWDIDPVYSKDLVIQLNRDSVVTGFEIKEWKH